MGKVVDEGAVPPDDPMFDGAPSVFIPCRFPSGAPSSEDRLTNSRFGVRTLGPEDGGGPSTNVDKGDAPKSPIKRA